VLGDGGAFYVAAGLNFGGDLFRDIIRPMLKRVEGDNADRVVEFGNYGFEISPLGFGFAINAAQPAKAVNYEVDSLIRAVAAWDPEVPHWNTAYMCLGNQRYKASHKYKLWNRNSFSQWLLVGWSPSEAGLGYHPISNPKMILAFAIFAARGTSVIALPAFAPKAIEAVALAKADRLPIRSVAQNCFKQVWPDFVTACLRNSGSEAKIVEAGLVTVRR
jgi:hypothetical protein